MTGHKRTLPIVLRTDPGYVIEAPNIKGKVWPAKDIVDPGMHGYFAEESNHMYGIMYAHGPAFKKSSKLGPIHQVVRSKLNIYDNV